jgi:eukaryotic-like serine/threonine-protein kinase
VDTHCAGTAAFDDLFAAVCRKGVDTLINDARAANIAARLPAWFQQHVDASAVLLPPMALKGATFALICADKANLGEICIDEREL